MNELIEKVDISFSLVSLGFLNQLLLFLGKSGKVESMMKVIKDFSTCHYILDYSVGLSIV